MRDPDDAAAFDAFYRTTRDRLLLQAFALTGDLSASRRAVRDTFVTAWHHWPKVGRLEDPESWARPRAWAHALRRDAARPWHRERHLDDEARATLEALSSLSLEHRKVLLLKHLAAVSMIELAREVGVTLEDAERDLQTATAAFSLARETPSTSVRAHLEQLGEATATTVPWPRHTIIRRAGTARRRTHAAAGVVAAVTALVVTGTLVTDARGVRPTLEREAVTSTTRTPDVAPSVPDRALLSAATLRGVTALGGGSAWEVERTHDNAGGDGRAIPCQGDRYADPDGSDLVVREFRAGERQAYQLVEGSTSEAALRSAYEVAEGWFAACDEPRVQLVDTYDVAGVGDDARMFVFRSWRAPARTLVVGLARTGTLLTATVASRGGVSDASLAPHLTLLRRAVTGLCDLPQAGACGQGRLRATAVGPLPLPSDPALLAELDLPPAGDVSFPWVGSDVTAIKQNAASTRCDETRFTGSVAGARFTRAQTRTFLIPDADLPAEFGLTESVAVLSPGSAARFTAGVRSKLAACTKGDLGTDVTRIASVTQGSTELTAWRVTSEISSSRKVRYAMAILRDGARVAQVGFIAAPDADIASDDFVALARRALERLHRLPTS